MTKLFHGDCLDILPTLEPGSIDCVIADLPYGTTACRWDSIIPLDRMWVELKRLVKLDTPIVFFGSQPFTSKLVMSNPGWFRVEWIWRKNVATGFLNANRHPMKAHENILVFGKRGTKYNPQKVAGIPYENCSERGMMDIIRDKNVVRSPTINNGDRYPISVQKFDRATRGNSNGFYHPTQKPLDLIEYLVRTYSDPGDTVLDFCMGSGTTGVAAKKLGRDFIGIEKDADYFEMATERIQMKAGEMTHVIAEE